MKTDKFKEYLAIYGADINNWPEILRFAAEKELNHNEQLQQLTLDEAEFEQLAKSRVNLNMVDDDFASRIIDAALAPQTKKITLMERFQQILQEISNALPIPHPAYTFAVIAIAGFMLGVYTQPESTITAKFDGLLYETEV